MYRHAFLTLLILFFFEISHSFLFPLHASCEIQWKWPKNACSDVEAAVLAQIEKWNNTECGSSEMCRYGLVSSAPDKIKAVHVTPVKHYVDDLTFTLNALGSNGCQVQAKSNSETWYAVLDYGTNYCNLENLITGAKLNKFPGFQETTSNSVCTQYSSANCEKY